MAALRDVKGYDKDLILKSIHDYLLCFCCDVVHRTLTAVASASPNLLSALSATAMVTQMAGNPASSSSWRMVACASMLQG